ncbi:MAG: hypothetical protein ACR2P1_20610 [Pseudomonadales bacterium]
MSKLIIKNLPENKELDRKALAEFKGGVNPLRLLAQIAEDQEPELGVSPYLRSIRLFQNQPFTPH